MKFHAIKGLNEDSFGYDFISYKWKGAKKIRVGLYEAVELDGEEGIQAHEIARKEKILMPEDVTSTGDIAIVPGVTYSKAMGTEPEKTKKKRKKGSKPILGDQDK